MDLTIVIVNYNSINLLLNCLTSVKKGLHKSDFTFEIIVVDNASTDNSRRILKWIKQVKTIYNQKNAGFGNACNQGISKAKGKYILLLNPDTQVIDRGIPNLLEYALKFNQGFFGGQLLNNDFTIQPSCGLFFSLPVVFIMLFLQGEKLRITKFTPKTSAVVDWVSGACLLGQKEDFLKVGGFDENIFLYTEEVDLLFRAKQMNLICHYYYGARFIHLGAAISGKETAIINLFKGLQYFYKKHYSKLEWFILTVLLYIKGTIGIVIGIIGLRPGMKKQYKSALQQLSLK